MMHANLRPIDQARAGRLILAWLEGQKDALDLSLEEAAGDPVGPPGLLFAVTKLAAECGSALAGEGFAEQLREGILAAVSMEDTAE